MSTVNYNTVMLHHWHANMDIQHVNNAEGVAYYVCSYICVKVSLTTYDLLSVNSELVFYNHSLHLLNITDSGKLNVYLNTFPLL